MKTSSGEESIALLSCPSSGHIETHIGSKRVRSQIWAFCKCFQVSMSSIYAHYIFMLKFLFSSFWPSELMCFTTQYFVMLFC